LTEDGNYCLGASWLAYTAHATHKKQRKKDKISIRPETFHILPRDALFA